MLFFLDGRLTQYLWISSNSDLECIRIFSNRWLDNDIPETPYETRFMRREARLDGFILKGGVALCSSDPV